MTRLLKGHLREQEILDFVEEQCPLRYPLLPSSLKMSFSEVQPVLLSAYLVETRSEQANCTVSVKQGKFQDVTNVEA